MAIKEVDASRFRSIGAIEQVQDEISMLSSLKHANIIALRSMHFAANTFYFVMDVASGGSLADYTAKQPNRCLAEEEARRIFLSITDALDYCHRR